MTFQKESAPGASPFIVHGVKTGRIGPVKTPNGPADLPADFEITVTQAHWDQAQAICTDRFAVSAGTPGGYTGNCAVARSIVEATGLTAEQVAVGPLGVTLFFGSHGQETYYDIDNTGYRLISAFDLNNTEIMPGLPATAKLKRT